MHSQQYRLPGNPRRILLQGDVHGTCASVSSAARMARNLGIDIVIQLGDFWCYDSKKSLAKITYACRKQNVQYFFIPGNHENYSFLHDFSDVSPHPLSTHVAFLPNGLVLESFSRRLLVAGGAVSIDKNYRQEGVDWWPQEVMSEDAYTQCLNSGPCDVMLSHDAPSFVKVLQHIPFNRTINPEIAQEANGYRRLLDDIFEKVKPSLIAHGHYHTSYIEQGNVFDSNYTSVCLNQQFRTGNMAVLDLEDLSISLV